MRGRGTSTALGYTLTLAISALLVTGLVVAGSSFVDDQREVVIRNELEVVGEQVASQLEQADRLAQSSSDLRALHINQTIPDTVVDNTYDVLLSSSGEIELRTFDPDVSVTVDVSLASSVVDSSASGGRIVVRCATPTCSSGDLVISND